MQGWYCSYIEGSLFLNFYSTMIGYMAYDPTLSLPRKAVLIAHDWDGRNEYENGRAEQLAKLGFVGFAMDVYGNGSTGKNSEENQKLMKPLMANRTLMVQRLNAALAAVRDQLFVDLNKVCFLIIFLSFFIGYTGRTESLKCTLPR